MSSNELGKLTHVEGTELLKTGAQSVFPSKTPRCRLQGTDGIDNAVVFPLDDETFSKHLLFLGNIGTGKTNAISHVIQQVQKGMTDDDILIVFDTKGDFYEQFYRDGDVVISNDAKRFRGAGAYWNVYADLMIDSTPESRRDRSDRSIEENASEIADNLFADQIRNTSQPFFPQAAKDILATFLVRSAHRVKPELRNNASMMNFFDQGRGALEKFFNRPPEANRILSYITKDAAGQAAGVVSELNQLLNQIFRGDFRQHGTLSIRDLVRKKGGKTVFIEYDITVGSVLAPIYRLLLDLAIKEAMGTKRGKGNVWFFIDEFRLIPNLQHIDNGINFGRSQGVKFILGIQNIPQVHHEYGESLAESLLSGLSTVISFRVDDRKTREFIQDRYGFALKKLAYKTGQVGPNSIREDVKPSRVVEDWDIARLDVGRAIVGLPGKNPFLFRFSEFKRS